MCSLYLRGLFQDERLAQLFGRLIGVMRRGRIELTGSADEMRGRIDEIEDKYLSVSKPGSKH